MSLPKEVQECLEKMMAALTLKEANDFMSFVYKEGWDKVIEQFETELAWKIQREATEEELEVEEQIEEDDSIDTRGIPINEIYDFSEYELGPDNNWENTEWMSSDGLTSEEVAIDNENYLLDLEGK